VTNLEHVQLLHGPYVPPKLRRGNRSFCLHGPWWTTEEDDLVKRLSPPEAARQAGRTLVAVYKRRRVLGLPQEAREGLEPSGLPPAEATGRIAASSPRSIDQRLF
jgi:hypothetical protein